MTAAPQVALHHAQTVQVMCSQEHLLTGLFLVFKLAPLPAGEQALHDHVVASAAKRPPAPVIPKRPDEPLAPTVVEAPEAPPRPKKGASTIELAAYAQASAQYKVAKASHDAYRTLLTQHGTNLTAYRKALGEYEKKKKKYDEDLAEYENWPLVDPPDPADRFVLGFVDHHGFLQPVHDDSNPWFEMGTLETRNKKLVEVDRRNPHSYKLAVGEKVQVCGVRHPSPDYARALAAYLDSEGTKDDARYTFSVVDGEEVAWTSYLRDVTVEKVGEQPAIKLSESPADFFPRGSARYGSWLLYREMPHGGCADVPEKVKALMLDLGKMRYPCGREDKPYLQRKKSEARKTWEQCADDLVFDGQVQACVARLQEHVRDGEKVDGAPVAHAFQVDEAAYGKGEWSYLIGGAVTARDAVLAREGDSLRRPSELRTKGMVDVETGHLIAHWLAERLRKPGHILLPTAEGGESGALVETYLYLLPNGAISVDVWDGLVRVFGCKYGIRGGSSLRSVNAGVWPGAINNSVHKTGLAMDMAGGATRHSTARWPIRFEAHWEPGGSSYKKLCAERSAARKTIERRKELEARAGKLDAKEQAELTRLAGTAAEEQRLVEMVDAELAKDEADGKLYWTQRWRVYGHSVLDVFDALDTSAQALREALGAFLGVVVTSDACEPAVRGKLWQRIKDAHFAAVDADVCGHWIDLAIAPHVERLESLLLATPEALRADLFRKQVVQFTPNAYEGDGGTSGKRYDPTTSDGDFPGASFPAKSWVNISSLAQRVGMLRIGPHSSDYRDQSFVRGPNDPRAAPRFYPFAPYFKITNADEGDVATMLQDIAAVDAPQLKQRAFGIVVMRDQATVAELEPSAIDGPFVKGWADAMRPVITAKGTPVTSPGGAAVAFVFSASDAAVAKLGAAADELGHFGSKSFLVTHVGPDTGLDLGDERVLKGSELKTKLKKASEDFRTAKVTAEKKARDEAEAAAAQKVEDDAAKAKKALPPSELAKKIAAAKKAAVTKLEQDAKKAKKKDVRDWTVELTPVFLRDGAVPRDAGGKIVSGKIPFLPADRVKLPVHSDAGHLEWWHFQHVSAKGEWGSILEQTGYSRQVMGTPKGGINDRADPVHRGLGYSEKDLTSHPGETSDAAVENADAYTPPGG